MDCQYCYGELIVEPEIESSAPGEKSFVHEVLEERDLIVRIGPKECDSEENYIAVIIGSIEHDGTRSDCTSVRFPISFCPFCGRKL